MMTEDFIFNWLSITDISHFILIGTKLLLALINLFKLFQILLSFQFLTIFFRKIEFNTKVDVFDLICLIVEWTAYMLLIHWFLSISSRFESLLFIKLVFEANIRKFSKFVFAYNQRFDATEWLKLLP